MQMHAFIKPIAQAISVCQKFVSSVKTGYVRCPGQSQTNLTTRFVCVRNFTILLPIEWGCKGERLGGGSSGLRMALMCGI